MVKGLSLQERKERLIEECVACAAGGGAMTVGSDGFQGSADPKGPVAGFDPLLTKTLKKLKRKDKKVEEGYEPLPSDKMNSKIKDKESQAASTFKRFKLYVKGKASNTGMKQRALEKGKIEKVATKIKKMNHELRSHDSVDSRFKELENRDRGEKK